MTVGVALKMPWSEAKFGPQAPSPDFVVVATDSRLTNLQTTEWWDKGEKIYQISGNALFAFAGNAVLGRRIIKHLLTFPRRSRLPDLTERSWLDDQSALHAFRIVLREETLALRSTGISREEAQLQALVVFIHGTPYAKSNRVRLFRFDTLSEVSPFDGVELKEGITAIGDPAAMNEARRFCSAKAAEFNNGYQPWTKPWRGLPTLGVEMAITSGSTKTVGGATQSAMITPTEIAWQGCATIYFNANHQFEGIVASEKRDGGWQQRVGDKVIGRVDGRIPFGSDPESNG